MKPQIAFQTDYTKLQTVVSYRMKTPIEMTINSVKTDSQFAFHHLYRTLVRGYDATQYLTEMLDVCFNIYVSVIHA